MSTGLLIHNRWGEAVPVEKIKLANHLWNMKQTKSFWEVVTEVIKVFSQTQPKQWQSFIINLRDDKETASVSNIGGKRFRGVSIDKSSTSTKGMTNVYQVDIPQWVMLCLRKLYTEGELKNLGYSLGGNELGKRFYREFGKKFPEFRILESF